MGKFKVTWSSLKQFEEEVATDCHTVEAYIMRKFGTTLEGLKDYDTKIKVELLDDASEANDPEAVAADPTITAGMLDDLEKQAEADEQEAHDLRESIAAEKAKVKTIPEPTEEDRQTNEPPEPTAVNDEHAPGLTPTTAAELTDHMPPPVDTIGDNKDAYVEGTQGVSDKQ